MITLTQNLLETLNQNPFDFDLLHIISDSMCEDGYTEKEVLAMRWIADRFKRPINEQRNFTWFNEEKLILELNEYRDPLSNIPENIFKALKNYQSCSDDEIFKLYYTIKGAYQALLEALINIGEI